MLNSKDDIGVELCEFLVENVPGELIWHKKPSRKIPIGRLAGTTDDDGYRVITFRGVKFFAHRLIYYMHKGYFPKMLDHINGIPYDNRIQNLRECTERQNSYNMGLSVRNKSGTKGVSWSGAANKWRARVWVNGSERHLGVFDIIKDAENAVRKVRTDNHGAFARCE